MITAQDQRNSTCPDDLSDEGLDPLEGAQGIADEHRGVSVVAGPQVFQGINAHVEVRKDGPVTAEVVRGADDHRTQMSAGPAGGGAVPRHAADRHIHLPGLQVLRREAQRELHERLDTGQGAFVAGPVDLHRSGNAFRQRKMSHEAP